MNGRDTHGKQTSLGARTCFLISSYVTIGADQSGLNVRGGLDASWPALDELHRAGCKFDRTANGTNLGNTRIEREETLNVLATRCMVR